MKHYMYLPEADNFVMVKEVAPGIFHSSRNVYSGKNQDGVLVGKWISKLIRSNTIRAKK